MNGPVGIRRTVTQERTHLPSGTAAVAYARRGRLGAVRLRDPPWLFRLLNGSPRLARFQARVQRPFVRTSPRVCLRRDVFRHGLQYSLAVNGGSARIRAELESDLLKTVPGIDNPTTATHQFRYSHVSKARACDARSYFAGGSEWANQTSPMSNTLPTAIRTPDSTLRKVNVFFFRIELRTPPILSQTTRMDRAGQIRPASPLAGFPETRQHEAETTYNGLRMPKWLEENGTGNVRCSAVILFTQMRDGRTDRDGDYTSFAD